MAKRTVVIGIGGPVGSGDLTGTFNPPNVGFKLGCYYK